MATDIELVRRIQRGDREALATLYARHFPLVWRYSLAHTRGNDAAARDVTSETFLAAMAAIGSFDASKGTVVAWLLGIARNKVADMGRARLIQVADDVEPAAEMQADPLEAQESRAAVAGILETLPDEERAALEWKYIDRMTVREIATRLDRTDKAVESILYRGREAFKTRYQAILDKQEKL